MLGNSSEESLVTAADSESIEHPILTQVPVSRARRYRRSTRSEATTASEESGGESASSISQPARSSARRKNLKGRKKGAFQAFRSPFFEGSSFNTILPSLKIKPFSNIQQEAKVKTSAVGGFFKCIRLWHRVNLKRYVRATCLPALYMDADESLSPLSEGNETSDEEGIKVVSNDFFVKSRKGQCPRGRAPAKGVRGRCTGPVEEPGSQAKTGRTGEEWSTASSQPEDHLGFESAAGCGAMVEEFSGQISEKDPTSDVTPVQQVTPPPEMPCTGDNISAGNRQPDVRTLGSAMGINNDDVVLEHTRRKKKKKEKKRKVTEDEEIHMSLEGPCPALETSDISQSGSAMTTNNDDDDQHRKRKKRKKEKKCRVPEDEEINMSLDGPCPALETSDISQLTSESAMTINNNDDHEEHRKRKKRKKEKKPRFPEEEEINVSLDRPCPAVEPSDVSQCTSDSGTTINNNNCDDEEHRKTKKRKKENKRKVASGEEINIPLDAPCPALETFDVSKRTSESNMTINSNHSLDCAGDQLEDMLKPRKKSKKKKSRTNGVVTEGELNVADTASTHETSTLAETTAGFKKGKSKKDKIAPCREDPETNPAGDNMEGEHCSFKHPADGEVECQRKKHRKQKMSETTRHAICEDTLVRGSGLTSAREKTRKRHHSFLSDDAMENPPKTNKISTCDVDTEPVENGETLMESLIAKTKKKKKCEGSVLNVRSSAETGNDTVRKKKKKMKDKADRESESPVVVDRETPGDIETTVLIKKKKCKKNTRPPSQGSTPAEARDESGVTTPTDSVAVSPRRCSSVVDTDATQAGNAAIPNDGATVKKKTGRKSRKNTSGVGTWDSDVPEQNIRTTTEPMPHWTPETESRLKKKKNKKKDGRVMDRIEAAADPGAIEAQHSGHEAEVTSQDAVPPESWTQNHHESSSPRRYKKKALKRKPLFNQGQDFLGTEPILT
ncbi:unnamed protein product [Gadus morhua 'NCC']